MGEDDDVGRLHGLARRRQILRRKVGQLMKGEVDDRGYCERCGKRLEARDAFAEAVSAAPAILVGLCGS